MNTDMSRQEKSSSTFHESSPEEIQEAQENTLRCIEALDQKGEAGLQEELDRIYPPTSGKKSIFLHVTPDRSPVRVPTRRKSPSSGPKPATK